MSVDPLQDIAVETGTHGDETETGGLHFGIDSIKEESVLEPSLAKIKSHSGY